MYPGTLNASETDSSSVEASPKEKVSFTRSTRIKSNTFFFITVNGSVAYCQSCITTTHCVVPLLFFPHISHPPHSPLPPVVLHGANVEGTNIWQLLSGFCEPSRSMSHTKNAIALVRILDERVLSSNQITVSIFCQQPGHQNLGIVT